MTTSPIGSERPEAADQPRSRLALVKDGRYRRIVTAVVSGGAARVLSSLLTLISLPLAVRYLGAERYGIWATVASVAVWFNLLDLGIANSLTNLISQAYARQDRTEAAQAFSNALAVTIGAVGLAACILGFWLPHVNWIAVFNASPSLQPEVRTTILIAAILMLVGLPLNLAGKLFAGYQELNTYNKTLAVGAVGSVVGLVAGIWLHVPMPTLFLLSFGSITLVAMATLLWLVLWHKPWLRPRFKLVSLRGTLDLLSTGWSFLLIQAAALVVFSTDNIIVSHYLGAAEVTPYSVTWRVVGLGAVLQALAFPALWPAYAEANARGDVAWIRKTFAIVMRATIALNVVWAVFLLGFGRFGIRLWAGPAAVPPYSLLFWMALWSVIAGFCTAQSCLLGALNYTRVQAVASALAAIVNLALSIVLVVRIGSVGVILGTVISYVVVLVVPQSFAVVGALRKLGREGGVPGTGAEYASIDIQPMV
ncbi:MAG: oligosaccharide flippase family protein [Candidatus Korobacteraceae bacterium]